MIKLTKVLRFLRASLMTGRTEKASSVWKSQILQHFPWAVTSMVIRSSVIRKIRREGALSI